MCQDKQAETNRIVLAEMSVEKLLSDWPQAVELFRHYDMTACIGCMIAPFCTLADAVAIYNIPQAQFFTELERITSEQ